MEQTFFQRFSYLCKSHGTSPNAVARELGASSGSVTAWKQGAAPRPTTVARIAEYFGVTTDYLLGKSESATPRADVTDEQIKFALFGGSGEITDEMYEEVKHFARYLMERQKKE